MDACPACTASMRDANLHCQLPRLRLADLRQMPVMDQQRNRDLLRQNHLGNARRIHQSRIEKTPAMAGTIRERDRTD